MRTILVPLTALIIMLTSCSDKSNVLQGRWEVIYIIPSENEISSDVEQAAFMWLNILSSQTTLTFNSDSLFVNEDFQALYKLEKTSLYYKAGDNYQKAYDYELSNDTLILKSKEEGVVIKLTKSL